MTRETLCKVAAPPELRFSRSQRALRSSRDLRTTAVLGAPVVDSALPSRRFLERPSLRSQPSRSGRVSLSFFASCWALVSLKLDQGLRNLCDFAFCQGSDPKLANLQDYDRLGSNIPGTNSEEGWRLQIPRIAAKGLAGGWQ